MLFLLFILQNSHNSFIVKQKKTKLQEDGERRFQEPLSLNLFTRKSKKKRLRDSISAACNHVYEGT